MGATVGLPVTFGDSGLVEVDMAEAGVALREEDAPQELTARADRMQTEGYVWVAVRYPERDIRDRAVCECGAPVVTWYDPGQDEEVEPRSMCLNAACRLSHT